MSELCPDTWVSLLCSQSNWNINTLSLCDNINTLSLCDNINTLSLCDNINTLSLCDNIVSLSYLLVFVSFGLEPRLMVLLVLLK